MEMRRVPFQALGGVFEQDDIDAAVKVMTAAAGPGGDFFPLPEEPDFQKAFARHEGADFGVVCNSCGTALDLCMAALKIGPSDEVIVPGLTFVCTATCAAARGAKVVFADIDPSTMCLDPEAVERKITGRTRAVIPVHFAGHACDVEAFAALSRRRGVPIIYDAAHAVGAKWKGEPVGRWGLASCYSFQSNKNMTTLGEGGAVVTRDAGFAETVRQGKTFGYVYGPRLRVVRIGSNYRLTKVQAAVGLTQLSKVDHVIAARRRNFAELLGLLEGIEEIRLPAGIDDRHACHLFVIQLDLDRLTCERDEFCRVLQDKYQVGTAVHYPAVWDWEVARLFDYDRSGCPQTERICRSVVSLPVFPNSTAEDLATIAWAVRQAMAELGRG
jgi:dTDP-4-amino-4,6-dideoxygalactose transaminase